MREEREKLAEFFRLQREKNRTHRYVADIEREIRKLKDQREMFMCHAATLARRMDENRHGKEYADEKWN